MYGRRQQNGHDHALRRIHSDDGHRQHERLADLPLHAMMRATFNRLKREDGFTLSEMLVVISILGLILGAFSLIFSSAIRHSGEIQEQNLLQTEVRAATDRIATRGPAGVHLGDTAVSPTSDNDVHRDAAAVLLPRQPAALPSAPDLVPAQCRQARACDGDEHAIRAGRPGRSPPSARGARSSARSRTRRCSPTSRREPDAVAATTAATSAPSRSPSRSQQ